MAQSASRGQSLYHTIGCAASNCHGANADANLNGLLSGAGSPLAIEYSATRRVDKQHLLGVFAGDPAIATDIAAWLATVEPAPPPPPPPPPTSKVVEYYHATFGHYFVTNLPGEITALDGGQFAGWARTGLGFNAYAGGDGGQLPVCRFFTVVFAPKSSHFYTPFAAECDELKSGASGWEYEGDGFFVEAANAAGTCPTGTGPVYRLYNNGQGGAPNHRYTNDPAVRTQMLERGWISEGLGPQGVIFCAPD